MRERVLEHFCERSCMGRCGMDADLDLRCGIALVVDAEGKYEFGCILADFQIVGEDLRRLGRHDFVPCRRRAARKTEQPSVSEGNAIRGNLHASGVPRVDGRCFGDER